MGRVAPLPHVANFLGAEWGGGAPRFPAELVAGYTRYVTEHGGVITWDVPIESSGHLTEAFLAQLRAIGQITR